MTDTTTNPTYGLVASRRGIRVDTETGWSTVVATDADECDRLAASFTAMAARLRAHPEIVEAWDKLPDLDVGDAKRDDIPEAMVRADEREQLADAGRLLPPGTETVEQFNTRLYRDGVLMEEPDTAQTREHAQARVDWHTRERQQNPDWRGVAVLVHRHQHATPWMPVEEQP